jgi:protocatechuate 3,4-dioxygenase beta subunit
MTTSKTQPGKRAGLTVPQPDPPAPGELTQTPREIEGPYFRIGVPERMDLVEPDYEGDVITISGQVKNEQGVPIPGAIVQFWSSDEAGNYDMVGYRYHGWQRADDEGRYSFRTIVPACYHPREAKHIHVKVQGVSSPITTQLYIEGEPGNEEDDFFHPDLVVHWEGPKENRAGTFDFVVKQVTEQENVTPESLAARVS